MEEGVKMTLSIIFGSVLFLSGNSMATKPYGSKENYILVISSMLKSRLPNKNHNSVVDILSKFTEIIFTFFGQLSAHN